MNHPAHAQMTLDEVKLELKVRLGRDVEVESTKFGKFICQFVDYNNPHPSRLVGDTEELAYHRLLEYLIRRENHENESSPENHAEPVTRVDPET
jgi:hypothetical protein